MAGGIIPKDFLSKAEDIAEEVSSFSKIDLCTIGTWYVLYNLNLN